MKKSNSKPFHVFVSYHRKSSGCIVNKIVQKLRDDKLNVWFDEDEIKTGLDLFAQIEYGLKSSNVIACFITKEYYDSENTNREIKFVAENKLKCIIVLLDDIKNDNQNGIGVIIAGYTKLYAFRQPKTFEPWSLESEQLYKNLLNSINDLQLGKLLPSFISDFDTNKICPICFMIYNLDNRRPILTQCHRIVCLSCLKMRKTSGSNYDCFFHMQEHPIPTNGFESMQKDLKLMKQIEVDNMKVEFQNLKENFEKDKQVLINEKSRIAEMVEENEVEIDTRVDVMIVELNKLKKNLKRELKNKAKQIENKIEDLQNKKAIAADFIRQNEYDLKEITNGLEKIDEPIERNFQENDRLKKELDEHIAVFNEEFKKTYKKFESFDHELKTLSEVKLIFKASNNTISKDFIGRIDQDNFDNL